MMVINFAKVSLNPKLKQILDQLLKPTSAKRFLFFLISDITLCALALFLSFLLRFDFTLPAEYQTNLNFLLLIFIFTKVFFIWAFGLYGITWRYAGLIEGLNILKALTLALFMLLASYIAFNEVLFKGFPRSVFFLDYFISLILLGFLRISKRLFSRATNLWHRTENSQNRYFVIGAGNHGQRLVSYILSSQRWNIRPAGYLDDDPLKIGTKIHGIKVMGKIIDLPYQAEIQKISGVILAIPSLPRKKLVEILDLCKAAEIENVLVMPAITDKETALSINVKDIRDINMEELLGRRAVSVEVKQIENSLSGKRILISGAAGSIGSEIATQVCNFNPQTVLLLDIDETDLYMLELKLQRSFPHLEIKSLLCDITNPPKVNHLFQANLPDLVFHAAAYKQVPMMEFHPAEAAKVNILGTYNLALASIQNRVEKFVFISTDKAVNPTSVMGATKRFAEFICTGFGHDGKTKFCSVRFGNVLGSRGSVIPIWTEQLKRGGPLTVTHQDMQRYIMTIPEAVALVLQASLKGNDGEVLVLDMGEPINVYKLAEEFLKLHKIRPHQDVDIVITGIRPGEKLYEELLTAENGTSKTEFEGIWIAKNYKQYNLDEINRALMELLQISNNGNGSVLTIKVWLKKYVKTYTPWKGKEELGFLYELPASQAEYTPAPPQQMEFPAFKFANLE